MAAPTTKQNTREKVKWGFPRKRRQERATPSKIEYNPGSKEVSRDPEEKAKTVSIQTVEEWSSQGSVNSNTITTSVDLVGCLRVRSQDESLEQVYSPKSMGQKKVGFAQVVINSHGFVLGDNPSVTVGPPLSISWEAFESKRLSVDDYEINKPLPREQCQMLIPRTLREQWLRNEGVTRTEMLKTVKEIRRIRNYRTVLMANPYNPCGASTKFIKHAAKKLVKRPPPRRSFSCDDSKLKSMTKNSIKPKNEPPIESCKDSQAMTATPGHEDFDNYSQNVTPVNSTNKPTTTPCADSKMNATNIEPTSTTTIMPEPDPDDTSTTEPVETTIRESQGNVVPEPKRAVRLSWD
jgi:hypothetical protein